MSGRSAVQAACWFALGVATWASPVGGWAEVVSPTRDSEVVEVLPSGGAGAERLEDFRSTPRQLQGAELPALLELDELRQLVGLIEGVAPDLLDRQAVDGAACVVGVVTKEERPLFGLLVLELLRQPFGGCLAAQKFGCGHAVVPVIVHDGRHITTNLMRMQI